MVRSMTRMTLAEMRAEAEEDLRPLGRKRIELMACLNEIDKELRPKVLAASEVEISARRIGELTGLARNTVTAWRRTPGR